MLCQDEQPVASDMDTSAATTPTNGTTSVMTATVTVPGCERSKTVVACGKWDQSSQSGTKIRRSRTLCARQTTDLLALSTSTSRTDAETRDGREPDNDVEMGSEDQDTDENLPLPRTLPMTECHRTALLRSSKISTMALHYVPRLVHLNDRCHATLPNEHPYDQY